MLEIRQLTVTGPAGGLLLNDITLAVKPGRITGLTGHSGSGKTTLLRSILGMLHQDCRVKNGDIFLDDINLLTLSCKEHRELCGKTIGFIPQVPMTAFDNRMKIGLQMLETFRLRLKLNRADAAELAKEKLAAVNLTDTERVMNAHPSELSGGMLQRVAAALILGMAPDYLLADEPTAALDEENRDLFLQIMKEQLSDKGILFVSHDVNVLQDICTDVIVIGGGRILERGTMIQIISNPVSSWSKHFAHLAGKARQGVWTWTDC